MIWLNGHPVCSVATPQHGRGDMQSYRYDLSKGLCKGNPTEWWFPIVYNKETIATTKMAISICRQCPVRQECLSYALRNEGFGIWGGMTEREREVERRKRGIRLPATTTLTRSKAATKVARKLDTLSDDELGW